MEVIHHGKHQLASIYSLKKKYIITLNCKQNDKNILLLISMSINTTNGNNYKNIVNFATLNAMAPIFKLHC